MDETTLTFALEREHHEIDAGLEAFVAGVEAGKVKLEELDRASAALRRHIYLEEAFLFPPLRAAGVMGPVLVMLREHGEIWRTLDALEQETDRQDNVGMTERCRELLARLEAHNAKEEPIIYPAGDARLGEDTKRELHAFIESGTMPEGWVSAMARPRGGA
ncbi:MAG: hemerythrin domain-containing protein [Arachnia sp.]